MPFEKETYESISHLGLLFIKGWNGTLTIDKLSMSTTRGFCPHDKLYKFKKPIVQENVSLYGIYDLKTEQFMELLSTAKIMPSGVECIGYKHIPDGLYFTCWGEFNRNLRDIKTIEEFRKVCEIAVETLSVVNVGLIHKKISVSEDKKHDDIIDYLSKHGNKLNPDSAFIKKHFIEIF